MVTPEQRKKIAASILDFEARRDQGRLQVYMLPDGDGGGTFEVAGINERYHPEEARLLAELINEGRFPEAEEAALEFIATFTDTVSSWSGCAAVESYLRDCAFNRGLRGAGRILQRALEVKDDGVVGPVTRAALSEKETAPLPLLKSLRVAREQYERDVVRRDESSKFWNGLVNRWNKAMAFAMSFLPSDDAEAAASVASAFPPPEPEVPPGTAPVVLRALRLGSEGEFVRAWQSFLCGSGFAPGEADGIFGDKTFAATVAFQQKNGLAADGVAGRQTLLKAVDQSFELLEEPAADTSGSNFPLRPNFPPLKGLAGRQAVFGAFSYVSEPTPGNPEAVRILGDWEAKTIVDVEIPQLRAALGPGAPRTMRFHRLAAAQLQGVWADWEKNGLLDRILSYEGSFNARFIRHSQTTLSNHAFGTAFDLNAGSNPIGARPPLAGQKGSLRELVSLANAWGFYWGGHFQSRLDGMHFEVAFLK
ncbi:M15 family metallopeptidase [Fundidesulfovibrio terrae]|uniref:M15 family metallopeptidase n=1 Tax=Fundidesulfovibrio terrae TaxID=2922866 RepID=UPI001FAEEC58|nr:M15 family metallopeptidase [Fundidesulfovibrio terrae]